MARWIHHHKMIQRRVPIFCQVTVDTTIFGTFRLGRTSLDVFERFFEMNAAVFVIATASPPLSLARFGAIHYRATLGAERQRRGIPHFFGARAMSRAFGWDNIYRVQWMFE